jgi:arginase
MKVQIFQLPYDSGHQGVRMGAGPQHFIKHRFDEILRASGHEVLVQSIEATIPFKTEVGTAFNLNRLLAERVRDAVKSSGFPLVLSGNCNSCLGTLAGLGSEEIGIIWFDAHGDFNTPEITPSGFFDGMALAVATGRCWKTLTATIPGFHPAASERVIHIGGRHFDIEEKELLQESGAAVLEAQLVRSKGIAESLSHALERLQKQVRHIYLHLDIDVLDPREARGNEFAPPNGLSVTQVREAIRLIRKDFTIRAFAITAYDPRSDEGNRALHAGIELTRAVLKDR